MSPSPHAWIFGFSLFVFIILTVIATLWLPHDSKFKKTAFLVLQASSLLLVCFYVLTGWRQAERQFVEIGQYYPLPSAQPLLLANSSQAADYILDTDCDREKGICFQGKIELLVEQRAKGENLLKWKTQDVNGKFYLKKTAKRLLEKLYAKFGSDKAYEDGTSGISLDRASNTFIATWESSSSGKTGSLTIRITVETDPEDALPRLIIEHQKARVEELPSPRNYKVTTDESVVLPQAIYLTANQSTILKSSSGEGFMPTITVSAHDPFTVVNAFIEMPPQSTQDSDDFVVNNGLYRTGNSFGNRVFVGTQRGIVATVTSGDSASRWQYLIALLWLWLIPTAFFFPLAAYGRVFLLVSVVQMLIAIRFILSIRAYLWAPYSQESIENAVLAGLLIPLMIFIGCFAMGIKAIGNKLERDKRWRIKWSDLRNDFPPAVYYLLAVISLPVLYYLLQPPPSVVENVYSTTFQYSAEFLKSLLLLVLLPVAVLSVGLLLDKNLQKKQNREGDYQSSVDDPITYAITKEESDDFKEEKWNWKNLFWQLSRVSIPTLVIVLIWWFSNKRSGGAEILKLIQGIAALFLAAFLFRFSKSAYSVTAKKGYSRTLGVAARALAFIAILVGLILLIRVAWNFAFSSMPARPENILPLVPILTNTVFELLIVGLMIRILAAFFAGWGKADMPFGKRGFFDLFVVFVSPVLMFFISFLASNDTGAALVCLPPLIGGILMVTGLWPLWKYSRGRRDALSALLLAAFVIAFVVFVIYGLFGYKWAIEIGGAHNSMTHRFVLREGVDTAEGLADIGGRRLIEGMEQDWRMMNYSAEGGFTGWGFGNAPVPRSKKFQDITLSDLVFSVYILAEHGAWGGSALLALFGVLFFVSTASAWETRRKEPLRLAFIVILGLMLIFPAIYMASANVNQLLFTGQDLPLLGLRSRSGIIRAGIIFMLIAASLNPIAAVILRRESQTQNWFTLVFQSLQLLFYNREKKRERLKTLSGWKDAPIAVNIALIAVLITVFGAFSISGILYACNDERYKQPLDLLRLKERANDLIRKGHIWFEPLATGEKPGSLCRGGEFKNTKASNAADPTTLYQLCIDDSIRGGDDGDTFASLVKEWNSPRRNKRGDAANSINDERQFFRLDTALIKQTPGQQSNDPEASTAPLSVNAAVYRWASPFRPPSGWSGDLTEAGASKNDGGVLLGAGFVLPLQAASFGQEPIFFGNNFTNVNLANPQSHKPSRSFAVYEKAGGGQKPIFEIGTVSGALGALLRPGTGDFDLFVNGCPLIIGAKNECKDAVENGAFTDARSAPPIRLDYGDVIAYAPRNAEYPKKRTARYVFTYGRAQLGVFSYVAWVNGKVRRVYPQGESFVMARQIAKAIEVAATPGNKGDATVALTVDAEMNREVYDLLKKWRRKLNDVTPIKKQGSKRRFAVTLMDSENGDLLTLASDDGTPLDPNTDTLEKTDNERNLNLIRHLIGSTIKPLTASGTLNAFPQLHRMTLVDRRSDKQKIFNLPIGGKKGIVGHGSEVSWNRFLPYSDNLYAVTLALLGMCQTNPPTGVPQFTNAPHLILPFRLTLVEGKTDVGLPSWAHSNLFDPQNDRCQFLEQTPLARQLHELFDVRIGAAQYDSYNNSIWQPLQNMGLLAQNKLVIMNQVSPEITNYAFASVNNFTELRSILLGGEIKDLPQYGRVGSAWSNIYLAQAYARLATGRRVTAQIIQAADSPAGSALQPEALFPGALHSEWRRAVLQGLEGVARYEGATAFAALGSTVRDINHMRGLSDFDHPYNGRYGIGSGRSYFTVLCKTGTIDPDEESGKDGELLADSIFVFTAGIWHDATETFTKPITGAIYFEQGTMGEAQRFAAELLKMLNKHPRFNWGVPNA